MQVKYSIVLALLAMLPAGPEYAQEGTASGTFTVKGKPAKLAYVYATADMDWYDKGKDVRVVLSDVKLTPEQLDDPFALQRLMKVNQVHAVMAAINAKGDVLTTVLYDAAFAMDSVSSAGTNNKFEGTVAPAEIEGKVFTVKPGTFDKTAYQFSATFKAPIRRKPVAATAKAAPRTPEQDAALKAAQAYMKAARAGDVPGLKAAVTADAAPDLDGPQGQQIVEMLKLMVPANPTVGPIEITGETAVIKFEEKDGSSTSTSTLRLKKVGGIWKVSPKG